MAPGRWMCAGGGQAVRVVHGDGQVISIFPPVKVGDIIDNYPHNYICHMSPELPSNRSAMLPLDYELEPGYVYFLLPLPRLFPTCPSGPPACCCLSNHDTTHGGPGGAAAAVSSSSSSFQKGSFSPLRVKQMVMERIGSPLQRTAKKKVSPELARSPAGSRQFSSGQLDSALSPLLSPMYGSSKSLLRFRKGSPSPKRSSPNRLRENVKARIRSGGEPGSTETLCSKWRPGLGCISETDAFVTAYEELRLCLDRRRLTFDYKHRPAGGGHSPLKLSDVFSRKSSHGDRDSKVEREMYSRSSSPRRGSLSSFIYL